MPVAKGIIIAASVLVTAGIVLYENPHVREWCEVTRRKVALALHHLADEINPQISMSQQRTRQRTEEPFGASNTPRRKSNSNRQDEMHGQSPIRPNTFDEKRKGSMTDFDDLVEPDGTLKKDHVVRATAVDADDQEEGLRRRLQGVRGLQRGAAFADPFADPEDSQVLFDRSLIGIQEDEHISRQSRRTSTASNTTISLDHAKSDASTDANAVFTDAATAASSSRAHTPLPEQPLVEIATENLQQAPQVPPTASPLAERQELEASPFWSVNEWAEHTSPSIYASPQDQGSMHGHSVTPQTSSAAPSVAESGEDLGAASIADSQEGRYLDVLSEVGGVSTPGSWTEVGSDVSEGDHAHDHF
ncbi:hypothetical protein L228DRAFT_237987 [Xylona heveae TC161]|uniref:Uncharacterized protein n=1 Tax=Xylona heveae (strain CBS 132557 / TC161) TaxID=1328760 RepID=A0A165HF32_XYLHT|nr:hypothetical protein L228DRAFT_237987 [Xylona heveae TC161]KZF23415.1 hypothetical protein L228DRAFT_237987 [Xylona heveae TC161]